MSVALLQEENADQLSLITLHTTWMKENGQIEAFSIASWMLRSATVLLREGPALASRSG